MIAYQDSAPYPQTDFVNKVNEISNDIGINPSWLMHIMKKESNLKPDEQNTRYPLHNGPATGLIQFTPDTAVSLGTTVDLLKQMNGVTQLNFVHKYFKPYKGRLRNLTDTFSAVFFPAAIGKPDSWILQTSKLSRSKIAAQNPNIDVNKDSQITVGELKDFINSGVPASLRSLFYAVKKKANTLLIIAGIIATYFIIKSK